MNSPKKFNQHLNPSVEVQDMGKIEKGSGNVYRSIYIIGKRSNQIAAQIREELHHKLEEFATHQDNLEEVFENREQIEISKYYEKLPKSTILSLDEFKNGKIYTRRRDEENAE
ncbi:MAG: DNA-directed RNA polymerase subunit omega [Chitinophagales bacterium]|nr:DNA-directed RNA polymerase subunit omega [Chitinophagales bacterium]HPE97776.1 DNA-directed RNA polymerase subunit omega [Chitinophagales bacterium]HPR29483.1 DNA-directed RNA polymerase subunit omega [Chitinophagales bacterium]HQU38542.1 DNA-directed RNA polymerase subunit omega [Chitinophagales bacterium]HQU75464.1 DNA-directed RNA polymerase subunit omega [Chitinophagales bacterium]